MYSLSKYLISHKQVNKNIVISNYVLPKNTASLLIINNNNNYTGLININKPKLFIKQRYDFRDSKEIQNIKQNTELNINTVDINDTLTIMKRFTTFDSEFKKISQKIIKADQLYDCKFFGFYYDIYFKSVIADKYFDMSNLNYHEFRYFDFKYIENLDICTDKSPLDVINKIEKLNLLLPNRVNIHKKFNDGDPISFPNDLSINYNIIYHINTIKQSHLSSILGKYINNYKYPTFRIKKMIIDQDSSHGLLLYLINNGSIMAHLIK
jgi:hypothetical protein